MVEPAPLGWTRPGLARTLSGETFVPAEWNRQQMFHCRVREWSPDVAAWLTEIFVDALQEVAPTEGMTLLTASVRYP